ncbi:MAG: hypothetical protein ACHQF2_01475 [Flavobacteriales bacterium]
MSFSYYKLLFFSLGITVGLYLLFYVYRAYIRRANAAAGASRGFARLLPLEIPSKGGELQFRFYIDVEQQIALEICDTSNNTLFSLVDKVFSPGEHVVRFDSAKLSDNQYFYRLKTKGQEIIKKLELEVHSEK